MRFIGNIEGKVDAKGRVFLPSQFRKELLKGSADSVILGLDVFQNCLVIYPKEVFEEQVATLRGRLNRFNREHQMLFRQFVSGVEELIPDSNGRILLSRRSIALAGIRRDVRFIGMDDVVEVWSKERSDSPFMDLNDFSEQLQDVMKADLTFADLSDDDEEDIL